MNYDWPQLTGTFTNPVSMATPLFTTNAKEDME